MSHFSPRQRELALSFGRSLIPVGRVFPGANERTLGSLEELVGGNKRAIGVLSGMMELLDKAAILRTGRPFSRLSAGKRDELLGRWLKDSSLRLPVMALGFAFKAAHFDDEEVYAAAGKTYRKGGPAEPERWLSQVSDATDFEDGEQIECDVVVVGTGAGGAVVGTELALKGHAVVFLEEGKLYRRDAFTGNLHEAHKKFYRGGGAVPSVGNTIIPILMGKLVGGSTAINTGVSYHTPDRVLNRWCENIGTDEFEPSRMAPYFEKVDRELQVVHSEDKFLQGAARKIAEGCDALGWNHYDLQRNAPGCTGEGVCDLGCPSMARRSVDIAYLPQAAARGAMVIKESKAHRVMIENGRAVGIHAKSVETGQDLWIRARKVVLAGGAVMTPVMLLEQGICNSSGELGKNLAVHPSTGVSGLFDEVLEGEAFVPNTRSCDEFLGREGILLQSGRGSLNMAPITIPFVGREFMDLIEDYDKVVGFGTMIEDVARPGRVRSMGGGKPLVTYSLTDEDTKKLHRGMYLGAKMLLAAGAERAMPLLFRFPSIRNQSELEAFGKLKVKASELMLTSWHPLGTCDIGKDPKKSVVSPDHETHDVKGLYIVDGGTVPGPLGVNPQITIMAMATRAAERIHAAL
ncbi:MAG: GMC family oxidoreductase [Chrysiogenetes bacterium]|nr:GMC family oxidoreductase [Chrysiogenetes bacterium]